MTRRIWQLNSTLLVIFLSVLISQTHAKIEWSGDVIPTDPSTWTSTTTSYIGKTGNGSLYIRNGSQIISRYSYIGEESGSVGVVTVEGAGSKWNSGIGFWIGQYGNGTLNIINGGQVENHNSIIGAYSSSTGIATVNGNGSEWIDYGTFTVENRGTLNVINGGVFESQMSFIFGGSSGKVNIDGIGSRWECGGLYISSSDSGKGMLNITNGGEVTTHTEVWVGSQFNSIGEVTVNGVGSKWNLIGNSFIGGEGEGVLNIFNHGLVMVSGGLSIIDGDDFINMSTGGMLALYGKTDGSLTDFLSLIYGTDAIRYWDASIMDWADITTAFYGIDYTLDYHTEGELSGYTVLTVPEPGAVVLLGLGGSLLRKRRE